MPEQRIKTTPFIREAMRYATQAKSFGISPYREDLQFAAREHNEEFVGNGRETIAIGNINPQKLTAFSYVGLHPIQAKRIFYTQRIFETLFPYNFPTFHAVFGTERYSPISRFISGSIRQRIYPTNDEVIHPLEEIREACRTLRIPSVFHDEHEENIIVSNGSEYYVDPLDIPGLSQYSSEINQHMKRRQYSQEAITKVNHSLDRLAYFEPYF